MARLFYGVPAASLVCGLTVCVASQGAGQDVTTSQHMPPPLVVAGMPAAAHGPDWNHYDIVEKCSGAFQRVLRPASLSPEQDTTRDTTRHDNPWTPLAPAAIQVGKACLSRFGIATLPALALPSALQLAVALDDDSLVQAIVARQLAHTHTAAARAAVLDSAVSMLMANHWYGINSGTHLTEAHVQLARAYLTQLDALGAAALQPRVMLRLEEFMQAARYANDIDAQLTIQQELQHVFRQVPMDSLPQDSLNLRRWYIGWKGFTAVRILELTYLQTLSHVDLANFLTGRLAYMKMRAHSDSVVSPDLVGASAPAVTADYWYPHPTSAAGATTGIPSSVPANGKISVILFGRGSDREAFDLYADLRRLHQELPDVMITLLAQTEGTIGNEFLGDHAQQEAARINQYFADSLRLPGTVGVIKTTFQTVPDGRVFSLPTAAWQAYHIATPNTVVIVDPTGTIVYDNDNGKPFEDDLVDFVRRLHAKFSRGGA